MKQEINFTKWEIFDEEERSSVEFKEITSRKPIDKIVEHAEQYIIGFLNAQTEGDLYCGIHDNGTILGVVLNREDRDYLQRNIPNRLKNTDPPIPHSYYQIILHQVCDSELKFILDMYVVQIHIIKSLEDHFPYRTSRGSVYFKKGTSCPKMKSEEIKNEIKRRSSISLQKEANKIDKELENSPYHRELLKKRAEIAKYLHDVETMEQCYGKLLEIDAENSDIHIEYANACESIGDLEGALSILDDALQSGNDQARILQSKGLIFKHLDNWKSALYFYQKALKLNPDDYTIFTQIGILFRELGEYQRSIQFLNYALLKSPNYRAAKYEKKKTYYEIFKEGIC